MNENTKNNDVISDNTLWANELKLAITVADTNDNIIYMNEKSKLVFPDAKIGDNLASCHKQSSMEKINKFKSSDISNTYTVEKNGIKKFIHQTPWYKDGKIAGLVEFSIEIPNDLPHIVRD
jgi:transcriptional regulator with PAS, ATPase and Fis domain